MTKNKKMHDLQKFPLFVHVSKGQRRRILQYLLSEPLNLPLWHSCSLARRKYARHRLLELLRPEAQKEVQGPRNYSSEAYGDMNDPNRPNWWSGHCGYLSFRAQGDAQAVRRRHS